MNSLGGTFQKIVYIHHNIDGKIEELYLVVGGAVAQLVRHRDTSYNKRRK